MTWVFKEKPPCEGCLQFLKGLQVLSSYLISACSSDISNFQSAHFNPFSHVWS